jgi:phosphodiesterase/alkaline phosphatase D-like protein
MRLRSPALLLTLVGIVWMAPTADAQSVTWNSVRLTWTTPGDDSLTGTASQFDLRYSTSAITAANFASATRWNAMPAPGAPGGGQSVTVTGLVPNTTYWFAIKTADEVPNWSGISNVISRTTLAAPDTIRPARVATLAVTGTTERTVALSWTAVGDDSLTGAAASYDLRYSSAPITAANWASATQATGEATPGSPGAVQGHTVTGLSRQTTYFFSLVVSDDAGNPSALSNVPSAITPDQTRPAPITNLSVGFVWLGTPMAPIATAPAALRTDARRRS